QFVFTVAVNGEEERFMFSVDGLFADSLSDDNVYKLIGQELKISQVFSAYFETLKIGINHINLWVIYLIFPTLTGADVTLTNLPLADQDNIVYLSETYPLLLDTLAHLSKDRTVTYLSSKMRGDHGTPKLLHRYPTQNINIYRATQRGKL
uniref:Uncharacterized protein n=1 Tax=Oncorhynchus tshawytscha TaxID=74940 RepID=A0A8C8C244_ONCTS